MFNVAFGPTAGLRIDLGFHENGSGRHESVTGTAIQRDSGVSFPIAKAEAAISGEESR